MGGQADPLSLPQRLA